ncbi:MAG: Ig-like domain-containing protein [Thermoplasmatota archaeon]
MRYSAILPVLFMIMMVFPPVPAGVAVPPARETGIDLVPTLVYDRVLEVPPGGETRVVIYPWGGLRTEGYIGPYIDPESKFGQAVDLLPDWLKDDFINNMVEAGSSTLFPSSQIVPAFGDLDRDGDDDMVVGRGSALYFYRNIGSAGNPVYINGGWDDWVYEMNVTDPGGEGFISPTIFDYTHDGYCDLIWGDSSEYMNFMKNPRIGDGSTERTGIIRRSYVIGANTPTHLSPTVLGMYRDNITLFFGSESGELYYYHVTVEIGDEFYFGYNINIVESPINVRTTLGPASYSAPRCWEPITVPVGGESMLSVGSGEGMLYSYTVSQNLNGRFDLALNNGFFRNVAATGPTTPVPANLNGDGFPDLVLSNGNGGARTYLQFGTDQSPYWAPDPTIPAFEIENYESAFDEVHEIFDPNLIDDYLDTIIEPENVNYRDEIGFACAFTPPSQLRGNRLASLFVENARYIYQRDPQLDYVNLYEQPGDDYFTTTTYRVKVGSSYEWMIIPKEAYYWGVVHPRITEETVAYVDPDTGGAASPAEGGRFWREYLWEHADDEYPPGPDYPDDHTGRYVYYPRNFTPPLLKEELEGIDMLWDLQPYSYPGGFDDAGEVDRYPLDFREHALEKVSQWVEKTLPLNQQESLDDERPTQPVRIAATHNGNCGELQDLTIAAARCSLIPARGVHLPGEDHVWSEFYLGGWHQWDNYWSDAGGVVADDLNYWWGWGGRGGSGIWASNGAGQVFDVGGRYRSPDITGSLRVQVFDDNLQPVEGARVLVMSHWVTEQINIETGPYQGPLPTVPLPAIWGYTNHYGFCDLTVWRQNINVMVTSDLGTYVSGKFSVPEDSGPHIMNVMLSSSKPSNPMYTPEPDLTTNGTRYLFSFEVEGAYQMQRDFFSGVLYRNEMQSGAAELRILRNNVMIIDSLLSAGGGFTQELHSGDGSVTLSLSDFNSIKEFTRVRVKVWEVEEEQGEDVPDLVLANENGPGDKGIDNGEEYYVNGWIVSSDKEYLDSVGPIRIHGSLWDVPFTAIRDHPLNYDKEWSLRISAHDVVGIPGTFNSFTVDVYNETLDNFPDPIDSFSWEPFIKNPTGPRWTRLVSDQDVSWGATLDIGAYYEDPYGGFRGMGWMDDTFIFDRMSEENLWPEHFISQNIYTKEFKGGGHKVSMTVIDPCGNLQPLVYQVRFMPIAPSLNLTSPGEGDDLYTNEVTVAGDVGDDVELSSLKVRINDDIWDITDSVQQDGTYETMIRFRGDPGPYTVEVNATDNVDLWTAKIVNVSLRPPVDDVPPTIRIEDPSNGKRVEKGEVITFRGTASDENGLSKLELSANGRTYDILGSVTGRTFSYSLDTTDWSTGEKRITLSGTDTRGNPAMDSIHIEIYEVVEEFKDKEDPSVRIDSPALGSTISLGSSFFLSGQLFDDGPEIRFELSWDRGDSYNDLTRLLSNVWDFDVEIDTLDIISSLDMDPDSLRTVLENYPLIMRIEDGVGRQELVEHYLVFTDQEAPTLLPPKVEVRQEMDLVSIGFTSIDVTPIRSAQAEVTSPEGQVFRNTILENTQLDQEEEATAGRFDFQGPFEPGTYTVKITITDSWGNTADTTTSFDIEKERTKSGGGIDPLVIILTLMIILVLLAGIIYGLIRAFRPRNPPNN